MGEWKMRRVRKIVEGDKNVVKGVVGERRFSE